LLRHCNYRHNNVPSSKDAGHVSRIGEKRGVYMVLVRRPEGKGPLGRPRRRWQDNIQIDLQEVGWWHGLDLIGSG